MSHQSVPDRRKSSVAESRIARHWLIAALLGGALCALIGIASIVIHAGIYNIGADTPHSQPVFWLLETVRQRSIAARATDIVVPTDLDDPKRIASGAAEYDEMCSGCHLAPGMKRTEISRGLYPRAPELRRGSDLTPAEEFWVVKHGIKMTGMAAWGVTHDDELLWDVVAFLRKLPELTTDQYQALVKTFRYAFRNLLASSRIGDKEDAISARYAVEKL